MHNFAYKATDKPGCRTHLLRGRVVMWARSAISINLSGWAMGALKCNARHQRYKLDKGHWETLLTILFVYSKYKHV